MLSGCAAVDRQAYNKDAIQLKSVVVVETTVPEVYDIRIVAHPGASFGAIGALVAAADMQTRSSTLTKAVDPNVTHLQHYFAEHLRDDLVADDYQTDIVVAPFVKGVSTAPSNRFIGDHDAVVMIDFGYGYAAAGPNTDYRPALQAKVKVFDRAGKTLYADTIEYGYPLYGNKTVHLEAPADWHFKDLDALTADPDRTRAGLFLGAEAIATQISSDLRR